MVRVIDQRKFFPECSRVRPSAVMENSPVMDDFTSTVLQNALARKGIFPLLECGCIVIAASQ